MFKNYDKVTFELDGQTRLGVVVEQNGQPLIYNIDSEEETSSYCPRVLQNIKIVGQVHAIERGEIIRFVQMLVNSEMSRLDHNTLCQWLAQCPKIAFAALHDDKFICIPVEQPVSYTQVGMVLLDKVSSDGSEYKHHYHVLRCSNNRLWIEDTETSEIAPLDKETLFQYFQYTNNS